MLVKNAFLRILELIESEVGEFTPLRMRTSLLHELDTMPEIEFEISIAVASLTRIGEHWKCIYVQETYPDFDDVLGYFSEYLLKLAKHISSELHDPIELSLVGGICLCMFTMQYFGIKDEVPQTTINSVFDRFKNMIARKNVEKIFEELFGYRASRN